MGSILEFSSRIPNAPVGQGRASKEGLVSRAHCDGRHRTHQFALFSRDLIAIVFTHTDIDIQCMAYNFEVCTVLLPITFLSR